MGNSPQSPKRPFPVTTTENQENRDPSIPVQPSSRQSISVEIPIMTNNMSVKSAPVASDKATTPAVKKRKLSPVSQQTKQHEKEEKERQKAEEKHKKEEEKRLREEGKKKRDAAKEGEKRLKEEGKRLKEEEKKKRESEREEEKKQREEKKKAKEAAKDEERRRKEEEKQRKEKVNTILYPPHEGSY